MNRRIIIALTLLALAGCSGREQAHRECEYEVTLALVPMHSDQPQMAAIAAETLGRKCMQMKGYDQ